MKDVIEWLAAHCRSAFPRQCSNCGRTFESFPEYVSQTTPVGEAPVCYDRQGTPDYMGTLSYANCACGSTIALRCGDETTADYQRFVRWLADEAARRGETQTAILNRLREALRASAAA